MRKLYFLIIAVLGLSIALGGLSTLSASTNPIKHVVVIMQENRSFDHYFGTFPNVNGIPAGTCIPNSLTNSSLGCTKPYKITSFTIDSIPHSEPASITDIDNGAMDGFVTGEKSKTTMAYYDNQTIPYYWQFAKQYTIADNFYSSALSFSLPNHWYAIAGTAPPITMNQTAFVNPSSATQQEYLHDADDTNTIADLLNKTSISWKYYDTPTALNGYQDAVNSGKVFNYWNPFNAQNRSYTLSFYSHFVDRQKIFDDIQNNNLPQVSYVIPSMYLSEHPPYSIKVGQIWTTKVIDAIMNSPYWQNTVILVTWDDFGGYYDHRTPPSVDNQGSSIRVPVLIISPYAKAGFVDHTKYIGFESFLKFIESEFNLPQLTQRDAQASNILNALNFSQTALLPKPIPLSNNQLATLIPITFSPTTGYVGDRVQFTVNGFSANDNTVNLLLGSTQVAQFTTNATGSYSGSFIVPSTPLGKNIVTQVGLYGENVATCCFTSLAPLDTIPPTLNIISPATSTVIHTSTVTVSGTASDDTSLSSITWKVDKGRVFVAKGTTTWSFTTATLTRGQHTIQVNATDTASLVTSKVLNLKIT